MQKVLKIYLIVVMVGLEALLPLSMDIVSIPVTGAVGAFHEGIDLGIPADVKAPAAADGTVTFAGWSGGYGYYVVVEMADGNSFAYAHLNDIWVNVGDKVKKGDIYSSSWFNW